MKEIWTSERGEKAERIGTTDCEGKFPIVKVTERQAQVGLTGYVYGTGICVDLNTTGMAKGYARDERSIDWRLQSPTGRDLYRGDKFTTYTSGIFFHFVGLIHDLIGIDRIVATSDPKMAGGFILKDVTADDAIFLIERAKQ